MGELMEQYEKYKKTGLVLDEKDMPIVGGRKVDAERHNPESHHDARAKALAAAQARARTASLMGGGRLGGSGSWHDAAPGQMAARAAESRQRQWDEANGLNAAELNAMAEDDGSDHELQIDGEGGGTPMALSTARSGSAEVTTATTAAETTTMAAMTESAGSAAMPPAPSSAFDVRNPLGVSRPGSVGGAPAAIRWGPRGQGTWQQMPCPVCGPMCERERHGPDDPLPPQDEDEGADSTTAAGAGRSTSQGPTATAGRSGTGEVVDLTLSSDEEGVPSPRPTLEASAIATTSTLGVAPPAKRARSCDPVRQAGVQQLTHATADTHPWHCARCTFANASTSVTCVMECGGVAPGVWMCPRCSLRNIRGASGCSACGTWRYSRDLG